MKLGLECEICGHQEKYNLENHLKQIHSLTTKVYKAIYPKSRVMTGHSSRTIEYWVYRGLSVEEAKNKVSDVQKGFFYKKINECSNGDEILKKELISKKQREASPICIDHWLKKGFNEEDAIKKVKETQQTRSKKASKFKGKHHTQESIDRIKSKMKDHILNYGPKEWIKHFENYKNLRSKLEVDCFNEISNIYENTKSSVPIKNYVADIVVDDKLIIEVFGDFWHANPEVYNEDDILKIGKVKDIWNKDSEKINVYRSLGYDILIIWEKDWVLNKDKELQKIKNVYDKNKSS